MSKFQTIIVVMLAILLVMVGVFLFSPKNTNDVKDSTTPTTITEQPPVIEPTTLVQQEEVISTAVVEPVQVTPVRSPVTDLAKIKRHLDAELKSEINTMLASNYKGWNIMVNSIKDDPEHVGERWIVKYDVSTGDKGMLSDECTAWANISSEDDETVIIATHDTSCYEFLKEYI